MKKFLLLFFAVVVTVSCCDDTELLTKLQEQNAQLLQQQSQISSLQSLCDRLNGDVSSIKTLMNEISTGGVVTSAEPIMDDEAVIGYTLTFKSGASIDIYRHDDIPADQPDPPVAESVFKEVIVLEEYVKMVLADDSVIELPLRKQGQNPVKPYYLDEIAKTRASVLSLINEPCLVFPMITDIHYMVGTSDSPKLIDDSINNMLELSKNIRFDFLVCLGDIVQGDKTMEETEKEVEYVYDLFEKLGVPYYLSIGNHDTNRYYKVNGKYQTSHLYNPGQMYGIYFRNISDVTFDMSSMCGTNYYKDFSQFNIRCIFLNSNDNDKSNDNNYYGFTDETVEWFKKAINTDLDVYVFSHRKPGNTYVNDTQMTAVMAGAENFKMLLSGHMHYDREYTAPFDDNNPILAFSQYCNKCYKQFYDDTWPASVVLPDRKVGTVTEDCFDIVIIRPASNRLNLVRFGAGVDREFDLTTGESVGESANVSVPYDLKIEVDFSKGWPFEEPCTAVEAQTKNGEEYTYSYTYEEDGAPVTGQVKFAISKTSDEANYSYKYVVPEGTDAGYLLFDTPGSGSSFGLLSIPYVEDMYVQSLSVVHMSGETLRFNVRKGWTTASAQTTASDWVKKNEVLEFDFPLTASNGNKIAPGLDSATSSLRDYAINMRHPDTPLKKATFYYSRTKPE